MARPLLEINQKRFEILCYQHKSKEAICRELGVGDARTLDKWCKRTYNSSFSEVLEQKKEEGNTHLLADAMTLAKKNGAVMIFLLKNWCGMRDTPDTDDKSNGVTADMEKWFNNVKGNADDGTDTEAT